jgi:A/G-specific adenine glycosylase
MKQSFADQLLTWFDDHGRHNLPWQDNRNTYRVWVSEIMLQQTQVATVIPYFERFMARFPTLVDLAQAEVDEVLALWTGLGYYSRARNLHKCAQTVATQYQGEMPNCTEKLADLPGIGRSTAAAIVSQAFDQPAAILDGNAKRVLTRIHAIEGWPGQKSIENQLWQRAQEHTPNSRNADYTQAIMDLGATICKRNKPLCVACPMQDRCEALATDKTAELPTRKPKKTVPQKQTWTLLLQNSAGHIQLHQRPHQGIWGGLWSLPEFAQLDDLHSHLAQLGLPITSRPLGTVKHVFSHYKLDIHPHLVVLPSNQGQVAENPLIQWYAPEQIATIGLPSPIKQILQTVWNQS